MRITLTCLPQAGYTNLAVMKEILSQFGLSAGNFDVMPFGSGLINTTWKIADKDGSPKYILQKINKQIFKEQEEFAFKTKLIEI